MSHQRASEMILDASGRESDTSDMDRKGTNHSKGFPIT